MLQKERERAAAMTQARLFERHDLVQRSCERDRSDDVARKLPVGKGVEARRPRDGEQAKRAQPKRGPRTDVTGNKCSRAGKRVRALGSPAAEHQPMDRDSGP